MHSSVKSRTQFREAGLSSSQVSILIGTSGSTVERSRNTGLLFDHPQPEYYLISKRYPRYQYTVIRAWALKYLDIDLGEFVPLKMFDAK